MRLTFLVAAGLLAASMSAHADTLRTYSFGTNGSLTIDVDSGKVVQSTTADFSSDGKEYDLRYAGAGGKGRLGYYLDFEGLYPNPGGAYDYDVLHEFREDGSHCELVEENGTCDFPQGLPDFGTGDITLQGSVYCPDCSQDTQLDLSSALVLRYVSTTVTPEPSSFALLGSGLASVGLAFRRRSHGG